MREDQLKRLDELMARVRSVVWITGEVPTFVAARSAWEAAWASLRAELVAGRCENCTHFDVDRIIPSWPRCGRFSKEARNQTGETVIERAAKDFCCDHFEKKVW